MNRSITLLVISIIFFIGGIGRLLANECWFKFFRMEHLWSGEPFFIYLWKLLGVFVIWIGIFLFVASKDVVKYKEIIKGSILGLALFFVVSLLAGFITGLGLQHFLVDSIFSLFLIIILFMIQKK
jgi:hypothetical protein